MEIYRCGKEKVKQLLSSGKTKSCVRIEIQSQILFSSPGSDILGIYLTMSTMTITVWRRKVITRNQ